MKGPSPVGWHFLSTFQLCKWKFYLSHVESIEPKTLPRALLFGSACHEGLAEGFRKLSSCKTVSAWSDVLVKAAKKALEASQDRYQSYEDYAQDSARISPLLAAYAEKWFKVDKPKTVLEVETEHKIKLSSSGHFYTVRLDAVLKRPDGVLEILEHKTSSYSSLATQYAVFTGGQGFAYLYAAKKLWPGKKIVLVPDVLFMTKAGSARSILLERGRDIEHSDSSLQDWAEEALSTILDISERAQAIESGQAKPWEAFPRSREPGVCLAYNHPCEFFDICLFRSFSSINQLGFRRKPKDQNKTKTQTQTSKKESSHERKRKRKA